MIPSVLQLLKSWEYKNIGREDNPGFVVLQLLKSWEYKNRNYERRWNK